MAQWEEYQTGVMYLGYAGVTEFHLITEALFFATFWYGPSLWFSEVSVLGFTFELRAAIAAFMVSGTFITLGFNIMNVITHYNEGKGCDTRPSAPRSEVLFQLLPMAQLLGSVAVWAVFSPSSILTTAPIALYG